MREAGAIIREIRYDSTEMKFLRCKGLCPEALEKACRDIEITALPEFEIRSEVTNVFSTLQESELMINIYLLDEEFTMQICDRYSNEMFKLTGIRDSVCQSFMTSIIKLGHNFNVMDMNIFDESDSDDFWSD